MSNEKKNDGGPAFPIGSGDMRDPVGMTLRDYFAAQVIHGMYANSNQYNTTYYTVDYKAKMAYDMADAMLKAREQ